MGMLKTVAEVKGIYDEDLKEALRILEERGFLILAESGHVWDGRCETLKILKAAKTTLNKKEEQHGVKRYD